MTYRQQFALWTAAMVLVTVVGVAVFAIQYGGL